MRIKDREDLAELARQGMERLAPSTPRLGVGASSCGLAAGAEDVLNVFNATAGKDLLLVRTGCLGFCGAEPLVDLSLPGEGRVVYGPVDAQKAEAMLGDIQSGRFPIEGALGMFDSPEGSRVTGVPALSEHPFYKGQVKLVSRNLGRIDPCSMEEYAGRGGYRALARAITSLSPEAVIEEVKQAGLRGRGGAGFPTGLKWEITRKAGPLPRFIIMNGDEGDPGAYMDRSLMEGDPHAIIEGMAIGAWAVGAEQGLMYVRAEYPLAQKHLALAIEQAREAGLLGGHILGTEFCFDLSLVSGTGAFVSGEETALINALEGRIAEPNPRPPYPSESGLYGRPTCINNVETWANVPLIIGRGADEFASVGLEDNRGTKLFCLVGDIERTGLVEVPLGVSLSKIVNDIGGGARGGMAVKAVQTGGPSGGCIPAAKLDLPADYDGLQSAGSIMGSGGLVVLSEKSCLVDVARYFLDFTKDESCGKCTPCREGVEHLSRILDAIVAGRGSEGDLDRLAQMSNGIARASLCGLGQSAPNPVLTTLEHFRSEYEAHVRDGRCPAGVCTALLTYAIDSELCTGCGLCEDECPVDAIDGQHDETYLVDASACIKCGACYEVCAFEAVRME